MPLKIEIYVSIEVAIYFFFRLSAVLAFLLYSTAIFIQKSKSFWLLVPLEFTSSQPFICVLPFISKRLAPFIVRSSSVISGSQRSIRSSLFARTHILSFTIKEMPPNFFVQRHYQFLKVPLLCVQSNLHCKA